MPRSKVFVTGFLVAAGMVLTATGAQAVSKPPATQTGITISPFLQQIDVQPSDTDKTFTLTLTNHTDSLQELDLASHDFGSLNDSGGVLLEDSNAYSQKYGLTSWLTIGADTVTLQPRESRGVQVAINNRESLQPGGHYGAVVASVNSLDKQSGNHVAVNQQLLSLILVNKIGGERYDLKLDSVRQNGNWLHLPDVVHLRFQNPGNVHVVPRGVVKLKSPTGKVLAQGIINDDSAFVLPESFRDIIVPLKPVGTSLPLPGLYHVEVDYRYDGLNRLAVKNSAVRFINLKLYIGLLLLLGLIVYLFRRYKRIKKTSHN